MALLTSDLVLNASRFNPANIDEKTAAVNKKLIEITSSGPTWLDTGAPRYREMRWEGKTAFPAPTVLPAGLNITIPSRDSGRTIPCRLIYPSNSHSEQKPKTKGVIMHIHGGGWVLMDEKTSDPLLQFYADESGCATISVGYRLAPEHPFPAGPEDCEDVADWLIQHAEEEYGGPLRFIGGESAGGHLSLLTAYHILRTKPSFDASRLGLLLHFGVYDNSFLPQAFNFADTLILTQKSMQAFLSAFVPEIYPNNPAGLKNPKVSPYYEDLEKWRGKLPVALFTCGTVDCLLDDSINMANKWAMSGGEQYLRVVEGGCHGFIAFDQNMYPPAKVGKDYTANFIKEVIGRS